MPLPAIIIWAVLLGSVAFLFIKREIDKKKYEGQDMSIDEDWLEQSQSRYPEDIGKRYYYFHYDNHFPAQGHILEDKNHKVVYEAKFLYNNVLGADEVDFVNHIINYKHHHKVGHTVETSVGSRGVSVTTNSTFKFDGVDVYDYLENLGYSYHFELHKLAYKIYIYKGNDEVGEIISSNNGKNLYEADGEVVPKIGGPGIVVIRTNYQFLDIMFLYSMVFARTELSSRNLKNK